MAKFRQIYTSFWEDPKVVEKFSAEDRYFYIYLLTNPFTTQIGIYEITKRYMAFQMGHSNESVENLLNRFETQYDLIRYNVKTSELAIKNWGKYNLAKGGKPMEDCITSELKVVKDISLIEYVSRAIPLLNLKSLYLQRYEEALTIRERNVSNNNKNKNKNNNNNLYSPAQQDEVEIFPYAEIISYLNKKAKRQFKSNSEKTKKLIRARYNEGFTLNDFKKVIDNKVIDWTGSEYDKFLRPETLFGNKFEGYLNENHKQISKEANNYKDYAQKAREERFKKMMSNKSVEAENEL